MKTEEDFLEWLSGAAIYIGYCRYGWPAEGFICASIYDDDPSLELLIDWLSSSDYAQADEANREIDARTNIWYECHKDPGRAMVRLTAKLRDYYFDVLNAGE